MKKLVAGLFAVALTFSAIAQKEEKAAPAPQKTPSEMKEGSEKENSEMKEGEQGKRREKMEEMMKTLNLTDVQQEKMKVLNQDMKKQMEELNGQSLNEEERREKRRGIMMAQKEKMNSILTDDQRKKWQEMRKERGDKMGERKEKDY